MLSLRSARSRAIAAGALGLLLLASVTAVAGMAATTDQTGRSTLWLVIGLSAAAFVVVAATLAVVIVSTVRPLAALRASARAIAAGDSQARAKVSGPEEIASLARDFNEMTDALAAKASTLQESEARYRLLAENVTDVIWTMDTNLRFTYVSPSVTRMRGDAVEEMVGRKLKEILTAASLEAAMEVFAEERAIEERQDKDPLRSRTLELEQTCKDGSTAWVEAKLTILRNSDRQPIGILGITRDITERKRAEEALRQSEEKYRRLVQDSLDGIVVTQGLQMKFVNPALLEMFGCQSEEEMVGRPFTEFISPEYRELLAQRGYARERGQAEPERYEYKALRKDGSEFDAEISVTRITYQGKPARHGIVRDVTERKRTEEALRESKELLEKTFASQRDPILLLDAKIPPTIMACNPSAEEVFGYSRQEMLGQTTLFLHVDEAALREFQEHVYPAIEKRGFVHVSDFRMKRKDGTVFPTEHTVAALQDEHGERIGWVSVVRDITDRKRAEEALRESEEKYRRLVQDSIDGIAILEGPNIGFANPALLEMFGCQSEEEMVGHAFTEFLSAEYREALLERNRAREQGQQVPTNYELKALRKDGSELDVEVSIGRIAYRGKVATQVVVRDISERKRAEEALQKVRDDIESRVERRVQQVNGCGLTFRELTVLHLVAAGQADKEIATVLGISPLTAHKHLANILDKMGAVSRTEAGVRALREGLLDYQGREHRIA